MLMEMATKVLYPNVAFDGLEMRRSSAPVIARKFNLMSIILSQLCIVDPSLRIVSI